MGKRLQNNQIDKEIAGEQKTSWNRQMLQNPYFSVNNIINRKRSRLLEQRKEDGTK